MAKLPDLPPSNWHSWDGAEKFSIEDTLPKKCDHYFERKGYAIECRKCHVGYLLNYPFYVLEGKVCLGEEAVI